MTESRSSDLARSGSRWRSISRSRRSSSPSGIELPTRPRSLREHRNGSLSVNTGRSCARRRSRHNLSSVVARSARSPRAARRTSRRDGTRMRYWSIAPRAIRPTSREFAKTLAAEASHSWSAGERRREWARSGNAHGNVWRRRQLERARPVLEAFGKKIVLCGPVGSGHAVKAVNKALLAVHIWSLAEALAALRGSA